MGPLLVHGQLANFANKGLLDELLIQSELNVIQNRLDSVGAPLIAANPREISLDQLQHLGSLLRCAA